MTRCLTCQALLEDLCVVLLAKVSRRLTVAILHETGSFLQGKEVSLMIQTVLRACQALVQGIASAHHDMRAEYTKLCIHEAHRASHVVKEDFEGLSQHRGDEKFASTF